MYRLISRLLLYGSLPPDSILMRLSRIFHDWESGRTEQAELVRRIYVEVKRILDVATLYGFDCNLWHDYLTFLLLTHENSFSLTAERAGATQGGSVNHFALSDFAILRKLFDFDFSPIEADLGIDCFSILTHYHAIPKRAQLYYRSVSERVRALSSAIGGAQDAQEVFDLVTNHYRDWGVGMFGLNRAFRIRERRGCAEFLAINNVDEVTLDDLIGYELQKAQLRENLEAFVSGRPYNNMLLYGDAGTGKSTSVKAALNEYQDRGLRMIELYKHQFHLLSDVISRIKNRNYRFILFIDDLSFEENEVEYKFLKAVIEGGVETRPDNVMIVATSNRRHLIRETWNDRSDMEFNGDVHRSDTLEERLSLAARFGCAINFSNPDRRQYHEIVRGIAGRAGVEMDDAQLIAASNAWELRHGGISGRTAQQFINYIAGKQD